MILRSGLIQYCDTSSIVFFAQYCSIWGLCFHTRVLEFIFLFLWRLIMGSRWESQWIYRSLLERAIFYNINSAYTLAWEIFLLVVSSLISSFKGLLFSL
jgi:hypothetical protein